MLVEFFLDEESSPIEAAVYYDADGPDEVEVLLGTFRTKDHAMLAVETAKRTLEHVHGYPQIREAFKEAQRAALECAGNLGLPQLTPDSEGIKSPKMMADNDQRGETDLAANVLASAQFSEQRKGAQRISLSDQQVRSLLRHLIEASGYRIDQPTAAIALGVPIAQLSGALAMVQRLLNVDQYPVVGRDTDGITIRLDMHLLEEQFGVQR